MVDIETSKIFGLIVDLEGLVCGLSAIYLGMTKGINEQLGTTLLPIGARSV